MDVTNITSANAVNSEVAARSRPQPTAVDSPDEQKLKKSAGEFESMLLASMWKSMKKSFGAPESDDTDPAQGTIDDWGIEVMSGAVGKAGGLGIGRLIVDHLEPHLKSQNSGPEAEQPLSTGKQTGK
jgi:Rod binding domain-containing protein